MIALTRFDSDVLHTPPLITQVSNDTKFNQISASKRCF